MHLDDLISSLKYLNRRQLLCFCLTNRLTLNIVENHFAEWPAIYCEFSIVHMHNGKYEEAETEKRINKDDICHSPASVFYMELKALNCDCEQLLSININNLCTYKLVLNCCCEEKLFLEKFGGGENEEYFELEKYENYKDHWHLLKDPISEIPKFRQYDYRVSRLLSQHPHDKKCCHLFAHQIHDQHRKAIGNEFIFEHRRKRQINEQEESHCPMSLLIRTTNFSNLIAHLKMNFVKIYKFRLQQQQQMSMYSGEGEGDNKEEHQNFEEAYSKILSWILENGKITNGTSCIADVNLIEELLGNLIENGEIDKQQILFDSIGNCGHLQLLFDNYKESRKWEKLLLLPKMPEMLLKNPLMITFDSTINFKHFKTIKNLLQAYNPQHDHRRLLIIEQQKNLNIADNLINKFFKSKITNTYFLLIYDHLTKDRKFAQKYYNAVTNEYLRLIPAYCYSVRKDLVPIYFARYSKLSTIADREFERFFELVGQNVVNRMRLCEKEMESQHIITENLRSWRTVMDKVDKLLASNENDELICSFSAFLARVFPAEFSLNIEGQQKKNEGQNDDQELYNADFIINFQIKLMPP